VYQALYQGEEQRERLRYLRSQALAAMEQLADFKPYLTGPVLKGTAGRYADIDLQVFADSGKELEIFLLNRNIPYQTSELRHYSGNQERAVSVLSMDGRARHSAWPSIGPVTSGAASRPPSWAGRWSVLAWTRCGPWSPAVNRWLQTALFLAVAAVAGFAGYILTGPA